MKSPVIVALDVPTKSSALTVVQKLGPSATSYKVGLQLLTEEGPDVVRDLIAIGKEVFLDLKLHEIPSSVAGAIKAAGKLGVSMVTVHASAGSAVLRAAVEAASLYPTLKVIALTVITSLSDEDLPEIGLRPSVRAQVERLALLAAMCGCRGVVASPYEAAFLSALLPSEMLVITPGIQLNHDQATDQVRVATPQVARRNGATHIIIGRSVTQAASPQSAFHEAVLSMGAAAGGA